jgi:hypothetical protein
MREATAEKNHGFTVAFLDFMSIAPATFPSRCKNVPAISVTFKTRYAHTCPIRTFRIVHHAPSR